MQPFIGLERGYFVTTKPSPPQGLLASATITARDSEAPPSTLLGGFAPRLVTLCLLAYAGPCQNNEGLPSLLTLARCRHPTHIGAPVF